MATSLETFTLTPPAETFTLNPPADEPETPETFTLQAPEPQLIGGIAKQAYDAYRAFPPVKAYNKFIERLSTTIPAHIKPLQETRLPSRIEGPEDVPKISALQEGLKGTARELIRSGLEWNTDVLATMMVAGPVFGKMSEMVLPNGLTLGKMMTTPLGKGWLHRKVLPKEVSGFRPESVLIPGERPTIAEAAEAAREGAAHTLSQRPLDPEEILELYKVRYQLEPLKQTVLEPPQLPATSLPVPQIEVQPQTAFGRMLQAQMQEVEQVPLHPARAGRAALKKIFGNESGFVALPEDEDALRSVLQQVVLQQGTSATQKMAENINLTKIRDTSVRAAMQEYLTRHPEAGKTPHISNDALIRRAQQLQDTPTIRHLMSLPEGTLESEALRNREEMAGAIKTLLEKEVGSDLKQQLDAAIVHYRQPGSIFGRGLQAQNLAVEARQSLAAAIDSKMDQITKDPILRGDKALIGSLQALKKEVVNNDFLTPNAVDKAYFVWLNSILSNPITHLVNQGSNLLFGWGKIPETFFQALVDVPTSLITKQRTTHFGEIPAMIRGAFAKTKIPLSESTKLDLQRYTNPFGQSAGARAIGLPTELLQREDEMAKLLTGRMELFRQAFRASKEMGLTGKAARAFQEELIANPTKAIQESVAKEQLYRTFQDEASRVGKAVLGLRRQFPASRWIIPFVKTIDRLNVAALERSPFKLLDIGRKFFQWKTIGKDYSQQEFTRDAALFSMGALGTAWVGMQFAKGQMVGAAPTNPTERAVFFASGKKPNSVRLGNFWVPFQQIGPLGQSLSMIVNTIQSYANSNKEIPIDRAKDAVVSLVKSMTDLSATSGFVNFVDAVRDPERYGGGYLDRTAAGFLPASGLLTFASRIQNPYYLNPQGVREQVLSRIPVLSEQVPKRLGRFGEPQRREPFNIGTENISRVDQELSRLDVKVSPISDRLGTHRLTNKEHNELIELSGPLSYQTLDRMFQHPRYLVLSDSQRRKEIEAVLHDDREAAKERMRIRVVLRRLNDTKSTEEKRTVLQRLRKENVLSNEVYLALKNRGLIPE